MVESAWRILSPVLFPGVFIGLAIGLLVAFAFWLLAKAEERDTIARCKETIKQALRASINFDAADELLAWYVNNNHVPPGQAETARSELVEGLAEAKRRTKELLRSGGSRLSSSMAACSEELRNTLIVGAYLDIERAVNPYLLALGIVSKREAEPRLSALLSMSSTPARCEYIEVVLARQLEDPSSEIIVNALRCMTHLGCKPPTEALVILQDLATSGNDVVRSAAQVVQRAGRGAACSHRVPHSRELLYAR